MTTDIRNLFLIDLPQNATGFKQFISCWVLLSGSEAVIIDPGPASTIGLLVQGLEDLGVKRLGAVLLTHIHIDHAGGVGHLLERFPGAPVLCHPAGKKHLADPTRLWEGSVNVLGNMAYVYGEIKPVPEDTIIFDEKVTAAGFDFRVLETPGHASHHLSFISGDLLIAGEALGTFRATPNGGMYLRLATPPAFRYDEFMASIDLLSRQRVKTVCFAHYGLCNKPEEVCRMAREQLDRWMPLVERYGNNIEDTVSKILREDPILKDFDSLTPDDRAREKHFLGNAVKGIALSLKQEKDINN